MADEQAEQSREEKIAALKAKVEAMKAARAAQATAEGGAAPAAQKTTPASALDVPVSSLNPGGRPGAPPKSPDLTVHGTINNSVEIRGQPGEVENIKKLLGGLGAYQNPIRGDAWQIDYRYYAEARRRLEGAGYKVTEQDYLGRPLKDWNPSARGWTRVES